MKKGILFFALVFILNIGILAGCSNSSVSNEKSQDNKNTIKIGASITPHTDILEFIKPKLEEQGIKLEIINLDSEDELNPALQEKQIDANYFQHLPYLKSVEKEKGYDFKAVGQIHIEPMGFYSNSIKSINDLKKGDKIGIPNNSSNEYRALKLLEKNNLITLKDGLEDYSATPNDIAENPKGLEFIEVDAAQLPRSLDDLAGAVINTNFVIESGMDVSSALIKEEKDSPYANIIVVRNGDENREEIKSLIKALTSDDVKSFLKEKYGDSIVPAF